MTQGPHKDVVCVCRGMCVSVQLVSGSLPEVRLSTN